MEFDINASLMEVQREVAGFTSRQVPFALSLALTRTAKDGQVRVVKALSEVFDRPTRFTLNSTFVRPARKEDLAATVMIKDFAPKGTPAIKYLAPQIDGGARRAKRFERAMAATGVLPAGMMAVPGGGARLDRHGNVSAGQITKLLSYLRTSSDATQNRGDGAGKRKLRREQYFVGRPGGGRGPLGVWQRHSFGHGQAVKPVMLFVRSASYEARLPFYELVRKAVAEDFQGHFADAMREAIETAR